MPPCRAFNYLYFKDILRNASECDAMLNQVDGLPLDIVRAATDAPAAIKQGASVFARTGIAHMPAPS